ncbi:MAG: CsbD family protein [Microthrixaceae bacterium]
MPNTDDLKGRAKEAAGDLTDDQDLKNEGKTDRMAGSIKDKAHDAKEKVEDAVDAVKDKLHRN